MAGGIKEYIGDKVALITSSPFTYGYGDKGWQNLDADELEFTAPVEVDEVLNKGHVYLDMPITNKIIIEAGGAKVRAYNLNMIFMFKSNIDWTPQEHEQLIKFARSGVMNFINLLDADNRIIKELSEINELEFMNMFDVNSTGIALTLKLTPKNFDSFCL